MSTARTRQHADRPRTAATRRGENPELASELKRDAGGMGVKIPLSPELLAWLEAKEVGETPEAGKGTTDRSAPENFKPKTIQGTPFVWGAKDARAVDINDVGQGFLGNCYLMAVLAALAQARPEMIENMISENADGTYDVRFPDGKVVKSVTTEFRYWPVSGKPAYAEYGDPSARGPELWVKLIEKAWALRHTSPERLRKTGIPDFLAIEGSKVGFKEFTTGLTGAKADWLPMPGNLNDQTLFDRIRDHFVLRKLPILFYTLKKRFKKKLRGSGDESQNSRGKGPVQGNHTYSLRKVNEGSKTVDMHNPWGPDSAHQVGRNMSFVRRYFRRVVLLNFGKGKGRSQPTATRGRLTAEERVAYEKTPRDIVRNSGLEPLIADFSKALHASPSRADARKAVNVFAGRLWVQAKRRAQTGMKAGGTKAEGVDDRPLYWVRLRMAGLIRQYRPKGYRLLREERLDLIELLERISRGRTGIVFPKTTAKGLRRILVSGFDPFGFQWSGTGPSGKWPREQGNPSGAAVLALDGQTVSAGKVRGHVEGVLFPVRYKDFDQGIVEKTFRPYLRENKRVDMIMTISQGTVRPPGDKGKSGTQRRWSEAFELEKWAGRRRTSGASDNRGQIRTGIPRLGGKPLGGQEFYESTLPRAEIIKRFRARKGRAGQETEAEMEYAYRKMGDPSRQEHRVGKPQTPGKGQKPPPQDALAVAGSGGGYLSNEVFYRTARLAGRSAKTEESGVPVGHLHVPYLTPPGTEGTNKGRYIRLLKTLIRKVQQIIRLALPHLHKPGATKGKKGTGP